MTQKGVWTLQQTRDQILAGCWNYDDSLDAGTLWLWGGNTPGRVGDLTTTNRSSPVIIPGTTWCRVVSNTSSSFGIKNDNTLWSWGNNQFGILGHGNEVGRCSPTQIPGNQWCFITVGGNGNIAVGLKTDNTLWSWGNGTAGALGLGNLISRSSPTQIPGTGWCYTATGDNFNHAIKTDGTIWGWGCGVFGRLGVGPDIDRSSPTQVEGTGWTKVNTGYRITTALKNDNTLWSWGACAVGNLVRGVASTPQQIPGNQWCDSGGISLTNTGSFALKTDGTLWSWGYNAQADLGLGDLINRSSPAQVPGTQWRSAAFNTATKSDGTLWKWGLNTNGILGLNEAAAFSKSSPTQLPGRWRIFNNSVGPAAIKSI